MSNSQSQEVALAYKVEFLDGASRDDIEALTEDLRQLAANHEGTLIWELSFCGNEAYGYERYRDKAAFLEHLKALEPLFPRIGPLWKTTKLVPTTQVDAELAEMLKSFGGAIGEKFVSAT